MENSILNAKRLFTVITFPDSRFVNIYVWDRDHWLDFPDDVDGMRLIGTFPNEYRARLAICRLLPRRRFVSVTLCPATPQAD